MSFDYRFSRDIHGDALHPQARVCNSSALDFPKPLNIPTGSLESSFGHPGRRISMPSVIAMPEIVRSSSYIGQGGCCNREESGWENYEADGMMESKSREVHPSVHREWRVENGPRSPAYVNRGDMYDDVEESDVLSNCAASTSGPVDMITKTVGGMLRSLDPYNTPLPKRSSPPLLERASWMPCSEGGATRTTFESSPAPHLGMPAIPIPRPSTPISANQTRSGIRAPTQVAESMNKTSAMTTSSDVLTSAPMKRRHKNLSNKPVTMAHSLGETPGRTGHEYGSSSPIQVTRKLPRNRAKTRRPLPSIPTASTAGRDDETTMARCQCVIL